MSSASPSKTQTAPATNLVLSSRGAHLGSKHDVERNIYLSTSLSNLALEGSGVSTLATIDPNLPSAISTDITSDMRVNPLWGDTPARVLPRLSTDVCNYSFPYLLQKWNAKETVNISWGFESHHSISWSFVACLEDLNAIATELANGRGFSGFNQKWIIDSTKIRFLKQTPNIVCTVSAKDWLAPRGNPSQSPLDKKLKLKQRIGTNSYKKVRSLSEFCALAGVSYKGANITIRIPKSTGYDDTTTVRELLTQRAITANGFVCYTGQGVEIKTWGQTPIHQIELKDLRDDFEFDLNGNGTELDGIKLHTEYRNLKVNLDFDPDLANKKPGVTTRWVFENCRDLADLRSPREDRGFYFTAPDPQKLRNPGINFDSGGQVKRATRITELNGTPTFEVTEEYGYAFATNEIYEIISTGQGNYRLRLKTTLNPNNFWKEVKKTVTDYIYDRDGYLIETRITGTQLTRMQQESEKLEAIELELDAIIGATEVAGIFTPDPSKQAQADYYKFDRTLPIEDITVFNLERHADYFSDTVKAGDECDPDFIEPKFVARKTRSSESYIQAPNPKNTEQFTFPQIVTGKFLTEDERTTITSTEYPFKFENRKTAQNAEGEYAKRAIALGTTTQNVGKPGIHQRLDRDLSNTYTTDLNYELHRSQNYFLNSPGTTGIKTRENGKSYPDIDNLDEFLAIAKTELSMINTKNSLTTTLSLLPKAEDNLRGGDRVLFLGKMWVVIGNISESINIEHQRLTSSSYTVPLGRYLAPELNLENRRGCMEQYLTKNI